MFGKQAVLRVSMTLTALILFKEDNFVEAGHCGSVSQSSDQLESSGLLFECLFCSVALKGVQNGTEDAPQDCDMFAGGPTILEIAAWNMGSQQASAPSQIDRDENAPFLEKLCESANKSWKTAKRSRVIDAIDRTLQFYERHVDNINVADAIIALSTLEAVDNKRGKVFRAKFPISRWKETICQNLPNTRQQKLCSAISRSWQSRSESWKPTAILDKLGAVYRGTVGHEKDGLWGRLNGECQSALVLNCEVPYVCKRTYLDEEPQSQYMLTHQLLHRVFIDQLKCPSLANVKSDQIYPELCAKMYSEAELIAQLDMPYLRRDLFVEQTALCGHLGFTNFFRDDWLESILSWQSPTSYGCFVSDQIVEERILSTDPPMRRLPTVDEVARGIVPDDMCKLHFTAVGLGALVQYWDFLEDHCQ